MDKEFLYSRLGETVFFDTNNNCYNVSHDCLDAEITFSLSPTELKIINGYPNELPDGSEGIKTNICQRKGVFYLPFPDEEESQTKSICICLLNEAFDHFKIDDSIVLDGTEYQITHVYLKCAKWNIELSKNVREVIIDRRKKDWYSEKIEFGTSDNSWFWVDEANPFLCAKNGSLYSKDKKILYFLNTSQRGNIVVPKQVETIDTGAIYNPNCHSIDFLGAVKEIKVDAIYASGVKFLINNAASQVQIEVDDIKKLLHVISDKYYNDVVFSKPDVHGCLLDNGNIELHRTVNSVEALRRRMNGLSEARCDYEEVYLVTAPIVKWTDNREDTDGDGIVLYLESCTIPYYPGTVEGTHIYYYKDGSRTDYRITVYETYEEVRKLIAESRG